MLIQLLPSAVTEELTFLLTESDSNGFTLQEAIYANSTAKLTEYLVEGDDFGTVLIQAFQYGGLIDDDLDIDSAKQATFGAINRDNVIEIMGSLMNISAYTFLSTIVADDNFNGIFDSGDDFYDIFSITGLTSGDLTYLSILYPDDVYDQSIYFNFYSQIDANIEINNFFSPLITTDTLQQYLSLFQDVFEQHFETQELYSQDPIQHEMQIFFNLIDQPVSDRLTESLDRQINKLGQYLFNADATESTSGIDTFVEFDDRMMDTSIQQEILHSENEIYLKLLTADNNGDYAFETLNERDHDSIALDNTFTTDYANGLFTTFADYTDGTNTIGLDSQSNSTYGDVDYDEGLAFINGIWESADASSMYDLLTTLYFSGNSTLENIFDQMNQDTLGDLYSIWQMNIEDFDPNALGLTDENGNQTLSMGNYFQNEFETDSYVELYLTHLDEQYRIEIDDDQVGSITDELGLTG